MQVITPGGCFYNTENQTAQALDTRGVSLGRAEQSVCLKHVSVVNE